MIRNNDYSVKFDIFHQVNDHAFQFALAFWLNFKFCSFADEEPPAASGLRDPRCNMLSVLSSGWSAADFIFIKRTWRSWLCGTNLWV